MEVVGLVASISQISVYIYRIITALEDARSRAWNVPPQLEVKAKQLVFLKYVVNFIAADNRLQTDIVCAQLRTIEERIKDLYDKLRKRLEDIEKPCFNKLKIAFSVRKTDRLIEESLAILDQDRSNLHFYISSVCGQTLLRFSEHMPDSRIEDEVRTVAQRSTSRESYASMSSNLLDSGSLSIRAPSQAKKDQRRRLRKYPLSSEAQSLYSRPTASIVRNLPETSEQQTGTLEFFSKPHQHSNQSYYGAQGANVSQQTIEQQLARMHNSGVQDSNAYHHNTHNTNPRYPHNQDKFLDDLDGDVDEIDADTIETCRNEPYPSRGRNEAAPIAMDFEGITSEGSGSSNTFGNIGRMTVTGQEIKSSFKKIHSSNMGQNNFGNIDYVGL